VDRERGNKNRTGLGGVLSTLGRKTGEGRGGGGGLRKKEGKVEVHLFKKPGNTEISFQGKGGTPERLEGGRRGGILLSRGR